MKKLTFLLSSCLILTISQQSFAQIIFFRCSSNNQTCFAYKENLTEIIWEGKLGSQISQTENKAENGNEANPFYIEVNGEIFSNYLLPLLRGEQIGFRSQFDAELTFFEGKKLGLKETQLNKVVYAIAKFSKETPTTAYERLTNEGQEKSNGPVVPTLTKLSTPKVVAPDPMQIRFRAINHMLQAIGYDNPDMLAEALNTKTFHIDDLFPTEDAYWNNETNRQVKKLDLFSRTDGAFGSNALHFAAYYGSPKCVKYLLEQGADPKKNNCRGDGSGSIPLEMLENSYKAKLMVWQVYNEIHTLLEQAAQKR